MIDLHSHFLPGIDDGARNAVESVEMLVDSRGQGVKICAGTPHLFIHSSQAIELFLQKRQLAVEMLNDVLKKERKEKSIPKLLFGAELYLDCDVSLMEGVENLCISGTPLMLLEFDYYRYEKRCADWLYNLSIKGITPIIAHIERYPYLEKLLDDIEDVEAVLQINAATLCGYSGRAILSKAMKSGKVIVASSDMHNTGVRKCFMQKAYKKIHRSRKAIADEIFCSNASELLGVQ